MDTRARKRLAAVMLLAVILVSCDSGGPNKILTVEEAVPRINALNGRTVSVFGYLPECSGYNCILYRNKADAAEWGDGEAPERQEGVPAPKDPPLLGIGSGANDDFDAKAAPFTKSYVVITGTMTNQCRRWGKPVCSDRTTDLEPIAIRAGRQFAQ